MLEPIYEGPIDSQQHKRSFGQKLAALKRGRALDMKNAVSDQARRYDANGKYIDFYYYSRR